VCNARLRREEEGTYVASRLRSCTTTPRGPERRDGVKVGSSPRRHKAEAPWPYPASCRSPRWGAVTCGVGVLLIVILVGTVASCSSSPPAAPARPEASASAPVTTSSPAPRAQLEGTAHVEIMGASEATFDVPLCQCSAATILPPPEGELNVTWQDRVHALGVKADPAFLGTKKTTGPVYLIINFLVEGQAYLSDHGECRITIATISAGVVAGSFHCEGVPSTLDASKLIDAAGEFSGSASQE
jgi:hypothetical protein